MRRRSPSGPLCPYLITKPAAAQSAFGAGGKKRRAAVRSAFVFSGEMPQTTDAQINEEPVPRRKVRTLTEEHWIAAAKSGDKEAMTHLLLQYEGLCRKAAGQAHLAPLGEDALAAARESFLRAVRLYDPTRGVPFPGYAKATVYGDLRTLFKKARRQWQREVLPAGTEDGEDP